MENKLSEIIKDIAIYLRKSRAKNQEEETDETLYKHKEILVDFAKKHDFRYVIYQEVVSGDSIDNRPEMIRLLDDVENELYDGVLVIDLDRLGRGGEEDSGKIKRIFKKSDTLIITPNKIYNLENEDDETYMEFQTFLARQEYRLIKKRLIRGKKIGSKMGNFTNGTAPIPYKYNPQTKGLIVDEEKLPIYNLIKYLYLDKLLSVDNIANELNKLGIPTLYDRGTKWHANVIQRILISETHLGKIISNKTKGNSKKGEKIIQYSRDKWIVVENCHSCVKTQEEHDRILELFKQRKQIAPRAKQGVFDFSGLLKCSLCQHSMTFFVRKESDKVYMKPCWYVDNFGNKCPNRAGSVEEVSKFVKLKIIERKERLFKELKNGTNHDSSKIELIIKQKNKQLAKFNKALNNAKDAYDLGDYTRDEWIERKSKWENEIEKVNSDINELNEQMLKNSVIKNKEEDIYIITKVLENLDKKDISSKEKNRYYKSIIKEILWTRIGNNEEIIDIEWR